MKPPIPELKCISKATAEREGYHEITTPIHPKREAEIFASVQNSMRGLDACWVEYPGERYAAARRQRELLAVEALLDDDERRPRRGGRQPKEEGTIEA